MAPPDLLIAGHIVKDLTVDGWRPGGSVLYAAAQARALGLNVGAVTVCGPDVDPDSILPGIDWRIVRDATTTSFENRYEDGVRSQRVPATARSLTFEDIPADWLAAPITLLAPVFHDIDPALPARLAVNGSLLGLGAQGWLRSLEDGLVKPGRVAQRPAWLAGDAVFVSEEDVTDAEAVAAWRENVPLVLLTRSRNGCTIWDHGQRHDLPAFETEEIDPTGAGDTFATAFLVRYRETGDAVSAARFGAAAAALAVRAPGIASIGGRDEIEALLASATARLAR